MRIARQDDTQFFDRLLELLHKTRPTQKVFYSAIYLQMRAKEYGFKCHDLRRVYAKREYSKTGSKKHVMEKLRHSSVKSTNIYLRSRIKIRKGGNGPETS